MKKIVWISDFPLRGSSFGQVTFDLLSRMPPEYDFDILGLGYHGMPLKLSDHCRAFELEKAYQLRYYFSKMKPDVTVVFHSFWLLNSMMGEIDCITGKKILYLPCEGEDIPFQFRKHLAKFDRLITPSVFSQKVFKKSGFNADVVPHGVDTEFFKPRTAEWREFRFGYLGLNDIRKQIPRVMEAYSRLKQGSLVIAAEQEGHYDLGALAKEYQITPTFIESKLNGLTMNREAIREFLQSLDVYIAPASESFGLPALEAAACGVPTIASSHGAAKEVLGNGAMYCNLSDYLETTVGKIGLISTADLYHKMRFMIQVKDARGKTGAKALLNAKKWPWETAIQKMIEVIEK